MTTNVNYGLDKVRFVSPVKVGASVRMTAIIAEVAEVPGGYQLTVDQTIELEGADRSRPSSRAGSIVSTPSGRAAPGRTVTADPEAFRTAAASLDGEDRMHTHGLGAWMAKRRLKTPDKTALIWGRRHAGSPTVSSPIRPIESRRCLWHGGIRKGDSVAYLGENSPEFIEVLFGAAQLGAVFVPVNTRLAPPEITHVLTDSAARVLIHDPEFTERVAAAVDAAGRRT